MVISESFPEEAAFQLGPLRDAQEGGVARPWVEGGRCSVPQVLVDRGVDGE